MKQSNTQNDWLDAVVGLLSLVAFGAILWACWQNGILFASFSSFLACFFGSLFASGLISAFLYLLLRIALWKDGLGSFLLGLGSVFLLNLNKGK